MHLTRKVAVAAAGLAALLAVQAGPASASATLSSNGSSASYTTSTNKFVLKDTNADGRYVYIFYKFGSATPPSNPTRFEWHGGSGTSTSFTVSPSNSKITFRTCTNYNQGPDNCSGWATTDS